MDIELSDLHYVEDRPWHWGEDNAKQYFEKTGRYVGTLIFRDRGFYVTAYHLEGRTPVDCINKADAILEGFIRDCKNFQERLCHREHRGNQKDQ